MPEGVKFEHSDPEWYAAVQRSLIIGMDAWLKIAVQAARSFAPVDTGRLAREIKQDPTTPYMLDRFRVFGAFGVSGLEYARAQELGSGIHDAENPHTYEIRPRYAKVLAFPWPNAPDSVKASQPRSRETGMFFFAKVNHPGVPAANEGRGYLRMALTETQKEGKTFFMEAVKAELGLERLWITSRNPRTRG